MCMKTITQLMVNRILLGSATFSSLSILKPNLFSPHSYSVTLPAPPIIWQYNIQNLKTI